MSFAVVNAKYNDPLSNAFDTRNVLVQGNKITGVGYIPDEDEEQLQVIDATKSVLVPGVSDFICMPHLDELQTTMDAVFSHGIQNIVFIPNNGVHSLDNPDDLSGLVETVSDRQDIAFAASATVGNGCEQLTELSLLVKAGANAIYFGRIIEELDLLKQALQYMDMIGAPIIFGPMTTMLASRSHLNDGAISFEIGVNGESISVEDRYVQLVLDLLDQYYRGPVHFQAISSVNSIQAIDQFRSSKNRDVTIGVCPYHFVVTDHVLIQYASQCKFNPPFRDRHSVDALRLALKEGWVDHFTSLHVPKTGDIYAKSFFDDRFGGHTTGDFLNLSSHLLIDHQILLGDYARYFQLSDQLQLLPVPAIDIHQLASFSILRASNDYQESREILDALTLNCYGGLVASVKNGTLYNV